MAWSFAFPLNPFSDWWVRKVKTSQKSIKFLTDIGESEKCFHKVELFNLKKLLYIVVIRKVGQKLQISDQQKIFNLLYKVAWIIQRRKLSRGILPRPAQLNQRSQRTKLIQRLNTLIRVYFTQLTKPANIRSRNSTSHLVHLVAPAKHGILILNG